MGFTDKKGITVASGFKLQAGALLDARCQMDTIADRDQLVTLNAVTEGLVVYVKETKTTYVYNGTGWDTLAKGSGYTHPTTPGNKHIPAGGSEGKILGWSADGTAAWVDDKDTTYNPATAQAAGLMSAADKSKLDGVTANANNYTHPTTSGNKHIPTGGSAGKILGWSADGTAAWVDDKDTTYNPATAQAAGLMSAADKTKLDGVATGANNYTHPATHAASMIVQDATHRFVSDADKQGWADKYTKNEVDNKLSALETKIDWKESVATYADIATAYPTPEDGWTVNVKDTDITYRYTGDEWIAISANSIPLATEELDGRMSKADKAKLDGITAGANKYTHPTTSGNKHIPAGGSAGKILGWSADGTAAWVDDKDTTYSAATAQAAGLMSAADKSKLDGITAGANNYTHPTTSGNKHIPTGGSAGKILGWSADGTAAWVDDKDTTYSAATKQAAGLMSAADKTKLDGVAEGANKYTHPATHPATMIAEDDNHKFVTAAEKESIANMPTIGFGTTYPTEAAPNSLFFLIA